MTWAELFHAMLLSVTMPLAKPLALSSCSTNAGQSSANVNLVDAGHIRVPEVMLIPCALQ